MKNKNLAVLLVFNIPGGHDDRVFCEDPTCTEYSPTDVRGADLYLKEIKASDSCGLRNFLKENGIAKGKRCKPSIFKIMTNFISHVSSQGWKFQSHSGSSFTTEKSEGGGVPFVMKSISVSYVLTMVFEK